MAGETLSNYRMIQHGMPSQGSKARQSTIIMEHGKSGPRKRMALQDDHRDKEPSSQKMSHRKNSAEEWQAKTRMLPHPLLVGQKKSCCIGLLALAVPPLSRILGRFLSWPQTLAGHSLVFPWMVLKTSPETMRRIVLWYRAHVDPPNCFQSFGSWTLFAGSTYLMSDMSEFVCN